MNPSKRTIAERNFLLATNTHRSRSTSTDIKEETADRAWNDPQFTAHEHLDFCNAISGDDLARIAAFEPKREPSLWADVLKEGARHVRSAA